MRCQRDRYTPINGRRRRSIFSQGASSPSNHTEAGGTIGRRPISEAKKRTTRLFNPCHPRQSSRSLRSCLNCGRAGDRGRLHHPCDKLIMDWQLAHECVRRHGSTIKGTKSLRQHDHDGDWELGDVEIQHAFATIRHFTSRQSARNAGVPERGDGDLPRQSTANVRT